MKVLVTGGGGYKGSVLVPILLNLGHNVHVLDTFWFGNHLQPHPNLKVTNGSVINDLSRVREDFDSIIHLASIANDPTSDLNPKLSWETSALGTELLCKFAQSRNVSKLIYASSGSVYGVKEEIDVTENLTLEPISDYNKVKMVTERIALSYASSFNVYVIRPASVYGYSPRMRLDLVVNMFVAQALINKEIKILGGEQVRPNVHINDICSAYLFFLNNNFNSDIVNVGFENTSVLDIAKKVQEYIPCDFSFESSNDPRSYRVNSDKIKRMGFEPRYNLENGIQELIKTFNDGLWTNSDLNYNLKTMKKLNLDR